MFGIKSRQRFSHEQTRELNMTYEIHKHPDSTIINDLAIRFGTSPQKINKWFVNKRFAEKPKSLKDTWIARFFFFLLKATVVYLFLFV